MNTPSKTVEMLTKQHQTHNDPTKLLTIKLEVITKTFDCFMFVKLNSFLLISV